MAHTMQSSQHIADLPESSGAEHDLVHASALFLVLTAP
jgi:hypothetical protein